MDVSVLAKSSTKPDEPYEVVFSYHAGRLAVICDCPAGSLGQLCKHKIGLIGNNEYMLYSPDEVDALKDAHELVQKTSLLDIYSSFEARKKSIEAEQKTLKKELSDVKKRLARVLAEGVK